MNQNDEGHYFVFFNEKRPRSTTVRGTTTRCQFSNSPQLANKIKFMMCCFS